MGISLSPTQLQKLYKLLPTVTAAVRILDMKPNTTFEGVRYRVYYDEVKKEFLNLEDMVKMKYPELGADKCQEVSRYRK